MKVFALVVLVTFIVCVGLIIGAWDDMSIRGPIGPDVSVPCQEDESCWDCATMGNQVCGPILVGPNE